MFEYQTTGTHLISYSALRFCLLMPERSCGWGQGGRDLSLSVIHRWVGALCLGPLSSSQGSSVSSESSRPYAAARHPEMLRILGLMWGSFSASGSGAGSSGMGKLRRSHGATVCEHDTHGSLRPWNSWRTHTVLVQVKFKDFQAPKPKLSRLFKLLSSHPSCYYDSYQCFLSLF